MSSSLSPSYLSLIPLLSTSYPPLSTPYPPLISILSPLSLSIVNQRIFHHQALQTTSRKLKASQCLLNLFWLFTSAHQNPKVSCLTNLNNF
ncbi:MAG: hypothetical protein ACTS4U_00095 [Candidatus Hodgkinia cicadicola]